MKLYIFEKLQFLIKKKATNKQTIPSLDKDTLGKKFQIVIIITVGNATSSA